MTTKPSNKPQNKAPKEKSRGIHISQWANKFAQKLLVAASIFVATKMQSQTTADQQLNTYNTLVTELDTNDDASAIASNIQGKIAQITRFWRQNEDTYGILLACYYAKNK